MRRAVALLIAGSTLVQAVVIDRIAIVVSNSIVKDSDISRDLRVTEFLNNQPLDLSEAARKVSANRLVDQIFIRKEIEIGDYPVVSWQEASRQVDLLVQKEFKSEAALENRLSRYGITAPDLISHFLWELTVLRFVDVRFKPAVLVTDADIQQYYTQHAAELQREHPGKSSLNDLRGVISDILTGERVNKLFFAWLDDQRKQNKIKYYERTLE
ncbi:MAG TPA: hypothetical protein VKX25_16005 [Bryobacteraceae bacterium]|jgi:hypothetical protein|nr:hypothetical protein [Bryobacteraceae bacterium]